MSDDGDQKTLAIRSGKGKVMLNENQKAVVLKLLPRVQHLRNRGLTKGQIQQTLVVAEGWPIGAVDATFERIRQTKVPPAPSKPHRASGHR